MIKNLTSILGTAFILMGNLIHAHGAEVQASQTDARSRGGVVACVSPAAADVGAAILKQGGNAVDAAIAVGFAEAVTWPEAGNIGGGGFMLIRPADGKNPIVIDYREVAPAAAKPDLFAKSLNYYASNTCGVPGTVRGFEFAHKKFGKLPWKDIVMPAVKLAEEGVVMTPGLAKSLNGVIASKMTTNKEFLRIFARKDGKPWKPGDILIQADLGKTLRDIAEHGPDAFYSGRLAELLEKEMKASNGLITQNDLKAYEAKARNPISGTYRGYEVLALPLPSGGGTLLISMLNMLENYDLKKHPWNSPETIHLTAEVMRRAYCERARYLGDVDVSKIPVDLTSKEHAKKLIGNFDSKKATKSEALAPELGVPAESEQTTHYSVMDGDGLAVSNTYTLENAFGCRVVVTGAGYILNNEMTDFNHKPGVTDRTGRVGTPANLIAPGKRMLSSQCPTMLTKDGKVVLITGSPGGRTIPNTVLSIIVNTVDYGLNVRQAVDAPRMHHQWFPDQITLEDRADFDAIAESLKKLGHKVIKRKQGDGHTISIDAKSGIRIGAADTRLEGKVTVFER